MFFPINKIKKPPTGGWRIKSEYEKRTFYFEIFKLLMKEQL